VPRRTRVLVVEDDPVSRRLLELRLASAGYDAVVADDGDRGWEILESVEAPELAVVDWMLPGLDGIEICRRLRLRGSRRYVYVILLTSRELKADVVAGLEAGADDYVIKRFHWGELQSRLRTGERIVRLESRLAAKVEELEEALLQVKRLEGLLPICMHCKRIRDDANTWHSIESYIERHSEASFTHSLCRKCLREHYPAYADDEPVS